jgi:predicted DNA-binding antitoxin AbrB/MazE fold protein
MTTTIKATYVGGVLKPTKPLALAEGAEVELTLTTQDDDPLAGLIGVFSSGRTDGAEQHDHYLYGTPKR